MTLDGVAQAPGRTDEDRRGGFAHGGWAAPFQDDVGMAYAGEAMSRPGAMLFGRRTYEDVLGFWTAMGPNPFVDALLRTRKYVASRSAGVALAYENSRLLAGEAAETVRALKEQTSEDLTVLGSVELVRALRSARLVDRYVLLVHPLVLGSGRRLFEDGETVALRLERSIPTSTGVLITEYAVAH